MQKICVKIELIRKKEKLFVKSYALTVVKL